MPTARDEYLAALVVATAAMTVLNDKFEAYEAERQEEERLAQSHREISELADELASERAMRESE